MKDPNNTLLGIIATFIYDLDNSDACYLLDCIGIPESEFFDVKEDSGISKEDFEYESWKQEQIDNGVL